MNCERCGGKGVLTISEDRCAGYWHGYPCPNCSPALFRGGDTYGIKIPLDVLPDFVPYSAGHTQPTTLTPAGRSTMASSFQLFEVCFISVPSLKAQEAGDTPKIVVPPSAVIAESGNAAIAKIAADNAAKVQATDGSEIRPVVRLFQ